MRKTIKKLIAVGSVAVIALAFAVTAVPTGASAAFSKAGLKAGKQKYDPSGATEYHAYFGFQQTETWIFRDPWYSDELGLTGKKFPKGVTFNDGIFQSADNGVSLLEGTSVTDAVIKGNGVYTVSCAGLNGALGGNPDANISMIYVDTDIPVKARDAGFTVSDLKLLVDGVETTLPADIFYCTEDEVQTNCLRFDLVNGYQKDKGNYPDSPSITPPNDSIEIQFTVSGMQADNPDAVVKTEAPKKDSSASSSASKSDDKNGFDTAKLGIAIGVVAVVAVVVVVVVVVSKKKKEDE